jgi:hypothetical protein
LDARARTKFNGLGDADSIQVSAGARLEISEHIAPILQSNFRVFTRDGGPFGVIKNNLAFGPVASHHDYRTLKSIFGQLLAIAFLCKKYFHDSPIPWRSWDPKSSDPGKMI